MVKNITQEPGIQSIMIMTIIMTIITITMIVIVFIRQGRLGSITQMLRPRASKSVSAGRSVQSMGFGKV